MNNKTQSRIKCCNIVGINPLLRSQNPLKSISKRSKIESDMLQNRNPKGGLSLLPDALLVPTWLHFATPSPPKSAPKSKSGGGLGCSWKPLGVGRDALGRLDGPFKRLGTALGVIWAALARFERHLGGALGGVLGRIRAALGCFGTSSGCMKCDFHVKMDAAIQKAVLYPICARFHTQVTPSRQL